MIFLATRPSLRRIAQRQCGLRVLSRQFVGGDTLSDAVNESVRLKEHGITVSLFYLGEYESDPVVIRQTVDSLCAAARALAGAGLDMHISVDPTQIGYLGGESLCLANARTIGEAIQYAVTSCAGGGRHVLMLDMEDASVTDSTLRLFQTLHRGGLPVAVTLQAYLHRTPQDLATLITAGSMVRLVKGAFAEPARHALTRRADIDRAYLNCARDLLSPAAREAGVYPVFGTHDHRMIPLIIAEAKSSGWPQGTFEFEMLYGVRPSLQRRLIDEGISLRLYLPYGKDWWPYSVRRMGEHPRNGVLMLRALADAMRLQNHS